MRRSAIIFCIVAVVCAGAPTEAAQIVAISVPEGSQDAPSHPFADQVWSVSTAAGVPLEIDTGIGYLVNPDIVLIPEEFSLCGHQYFDLHEPDPDLAAVTFEFDAPVLVKRLDIIQHTNGITQIEGFVGDSPDAMISLGTVFGPYGDVTMENLFLEGGGYPFLFQNTKAGRFFRFVVRKTNSADGYAAYRAFPANGAGQRYSSVPEPATGGLVLLGACLLRCRRRRRSLARAAVSG